MNESLLKSLIHLFVLVIETDEQDFSNTGRKVISRFLEKEFSREQINEYIQDIERMLLSKRSVSDKQFELNLKNKVKGVCESINGEFEQHQKVWLMLQLIEFIGDLDTISAKKIEIIQFIAKEFNISDDEFDNGKDFILAKSSDQIPHNFNLIRIDNTKIGDDNGIHHLYHPKLHDKLFILRVASTNTLLVKVFGENNFFMSGRTLKPGRAYIFGVGSVIRNPRIEPIYYSKVISTFFQSSGKSVIRLTAENIHYTHKGSKDGVYPFTFDAFSGQIVAIIGGSGVGKSTLINLLNGNLKPAAGNIYINGIDINREKKAIEGVIGFVPQDDLLVEDLTVFQNLYFSARFCFDNLSEDEVLRLVDDTIKDFDLSEARNLKVGNPVNKFISGGQRKRLNIAMELIREPAILFADEPTSGLSSFDSDRIMLLLKRQTFKGKLVVVNIHQPSSDIFKLFDKVIIMDQGGRVIFQGNPMDAVVYFKHEGNYLKAEESECLCCGNINTELILRVIEARVVNEYGRLTRKRKRSAQEWYELYLNNIQPKVSPTTHREKVPLPSNSFKIPERITQTLLFFRRNILSKLANRQFMAISLIEAPILAFILSFFSKYISGTLNNPGAYIFSNNDNIPSYLFMSIVACVFMGLTLSAEEIIRDQKVRQRERFLNLSYFSYINSKVLVLIIFSAVQSLLFVLVGNHILGIDGSFLATWAILFSTAVCANLIGLNISAALNSIVAIYITIPLIMVPMLLLSGVIVNYSKLHRSMLHPEYTPIIGDILPIRWAYEAICVDQFKGNKFNRHFFDVDQQISNNTFYATFLIPRLESKLSEATRSILTGKITSVTKSDLRTVRNELSLLKRDLFVPEFTFPYTSLLNTETITTREITVVTSFLSELKTSILNDNQQLVSKKDEIFHNLVAILDGEDAVYQLKRNHHNKALEDLVLNKNELEKIVVHGNRLIRRYNPVYAIPTAVNGRAHLFAPIKRIGKISINTFWFNVMVLWVMTAFFYLSLWTNFFRIVNRYMERFKFRRLAKRIARYIPR